MHHLHVPDMKCGGCLGSVTRAVQALDPQARVEADLQGRNIVVTTEKSETALIAALREAGYPAEVRREGL